MAKPRIRDVFTPGGQPTITYIDRKHLDLEKKLRDAIAQGFSLITITGPTKSGKTVLCRNVISEDEAIWLEGGQIQNPDDVWSQAAHRLGIVEARSEQTAEEDSAGGRTGISFGGNIGVAKAEGSFGGNVGKKTTATHSSTAAVDLKLSVLDALREKGKALVIDDFHYLKRELQESLVRTLKSEVFKGLIVVFLAVPHHAFDTIVVEREMQGRFVHVPVPVWQIDELLQIPKRGFPILEVDCPAEIEKAICDESFGSPLLTQNFCSKICIEHDVDKVPGGQTVHIRKDFNLRPAFNDVAKNFGFPTYDRLSKGPQSRSERVSRKFKDGSTGDIYQAILAAVASTGPKPELDYDDIRRALRELLSDEPPQKHEVARACSHMSEIAKEAIKGEPPIEWDAINDKFYLTDPFLMFYMKWSKLELT